MQQYCFTCNTLYNTRHPQHIPLYCSLYTHLLPYQGYTLIRQAASQESVANALKLALYSTQSISQSSAVSKSVYGRIEVKGGMYGKPVSLLCATV